jgi:hypothetical protein
MRSPGPWLALTLLGAFHGLNPAMGWLFSVSRGLQERARSAVLGSLLPISVGHALSIGAVVVLFGWARLGLEPGPLRVASGSLLIGFGLFKALKPFAHPRWVGMRVGAPSLVLWSFLMASGHGAGLMLLPALGAIAAGSPAAADAHLAALGTSVASPGVAAAAIAVHTASMLIVSAAVAVVVYERVGLSFLRRAWINLDLLWALALILAGVYVLVLGFEV